MEKKLCGGFIFPFLTKQVSEMHYSSLQFIFKPFFPMDTQKISYVGLQQLNYTMCFTVFPWTLNLYLLELIRAMKKFYFLYQEGTASVINY